MSVPDVGELAALNKELRISTGVIDWTAITSCILLAIANEILAWMLTPTLIDSILNPETFNWEACCPLGKHACWSIQIVHAR